MPTPGQDTESVDLEGHTGADGQRVVVDTILGWRLPLTDAEKAEEQCVFLRLPITPEVCCVAP